MNEFQATGELRYFERQVHDSYHGFFNPAFGIFLQQKWVRKEVIPFPEGCYGSEPNYKIEEDWRDVPTVKE